MNATLGVAAVAVAAAAGAAGGYAAHPDPPRAARPVRTATPSPTPSATATATPTPTGTPTCEDTAQTQVELNECAATGQREAERRLDAVLAAVRARTQGARRAELDRAHQQWLAYRDTLCAPDPDGGSIDPLNVAGCRARLATEHAAAVCTWYSPNADEEQPAACAKP